jgi:catechol 2,3-dioxygenase-like lactoylglutathione lyase family enzyme
MNLLRAPYDFTHQITRRAFLIGAATAGTAARTIAQSRRPTIAVRSLNHVSFIVSNLKRSLEFYQGLFGMPIQARQGNTVAALQLGSGPQQMGLAEGGATSKPGFIHFCMTTEHFDVDRVLKILADHGVTKSGASASGLGGRPLKVGVRMRSEDTGGAKEGTPELYFGDPDGILVQLQDTSYCGGSGYLGNVCPGVPEPAHHKGLLSVRDLSHVTLNVAKPNTSLAFYQGLFGMPILAHQGATPLLAVGSGPQFIALATRETNGATTGRRPGIAHVCLTVDGFNPDRAQEALANYGLKPRVNAADPVAPLTYYVRMRPEERGGAKGGTPELYFTDPDGITLQLQDTSYCGGSGYLGNVCR